MAKVKSSKAASKVPNKALYSRVSFLYQAGAYLATRTQSSKAASDLGEETTALEGITSRSDSSRGVRAGQNLSNPSSRRFISELRDVSHKTQIRMSPAVKHSICKNCDTMLIVGSTCIETLENKSKGGKKPWAEVLVRKCKTCGSEKRFPVGALRQKQRPHRLPHEARKSNVQMQGIP